MLCLLIFSHCLRCRCRGCIALAVWLGAGVFCAFFYRYIGGKLAGRAVDRRIGRTLNRSAMAFALDYRISRQLDHIFRFFSGDGGFDAGATLGHGCDGNLSACFRFVWFDGAGD